MLSECKLLGDSGQEGARAAEMERDRKLEMEARLENDSPVASRGSGLGLVGIMTFSGP